MLEKFSLSNQSCIYIHIFNQNVFLTEVQYYFLIKQPSIYFFSFSTVFRPLIFTDIKLSFSITQDYILSDYQEHKVQCIACAYARYRTYNCHTAVPKASPNNVLIHGDFKCISGDNIWSILYRIPRVRGQILIQILNIFYLMKKCSPFVMHFIYIIRRRLYKPPLLLPVSLHVTSIMSFVDSTDTTQHKICDIRLGFIIHYHH